MSSSQFNKGPSYGLSAEVKNRVSRAGGGGGAGTDGGLRAEKSRGCSEGPDAIRRMRSRVPGRGVRRGRAPIVGRSDSVPRGPGGLGGVPGTGRPHFHPGAVPCGVSGAMAPAPCSSAPGVSLLSVFPSLCVPRGVAPTQ